jgi:hypothetical protein
MVLVIGITLRDSHKVFTDTYNQSKSNIVIDDQIAKLFFDRIIRKASSKGVVVDELGEWIEVYYFENSTSTEPDCYARFYCLDGSLILEEGQRDSKIQLQSTTVCGNVIGCQFSIVGRSAQMILSLDNGTLQRTLVTSAYMHNEQI